MPSTYITKAQRKILIESYLECQDEMGAEDSHPTVPRGTEQLRPNRGMRCLHARLHE